MSIGGEFLDKYKKTGITLGRPTTNRYDVTVSASGTTLTYASQATITLRLPYGTGNAYFYFVAQ